MFSTQQYFGFDPRTIPSCVIWLDAADPNGNGTIPAAGSSITTWVDKTRTPNNMTATGTVTYQVNPSRIVVNGASSLSNSSVVYGENTLFIVAMKTGADGPLFTTNNLDNTGLFPNQSVGGTMFFASSDTTWYQRTPSLLPNNLINVLSIQYGGTATGSSMSIWLHGLLTDSSTTTGTITRNRLTLALRSFNSQFMTGNYYEVVLYNRALPIDERQQVEGYLTWKWGRQANLPLGHPYRQNPLGMRIFQPTDILNCILWLDGADARMVSVSGTNVTAWNDKSGLGNNLTTVSTTRPTYSSSTGAITFTSGNGTAIRGALNATYTNPVSLFIVGSARLDANATFNPRFVVFGTNGASATFFAGQFNVFLNQNTGSTPAFSTYANNGANPTGQGVNIQTYIPTTFTTVGIFENLSTFSGTTLTNNTFLNGNTSTFSAISTTWTVAAPYVTSMAYMALGNNTNGSATGGDCFSGDIYEVIVFSRTVTVAERQRIEGYLAAKWRLSSLLPTAHPYRLLRALPSTPLFTPTQLSGLRLWLDAADGSQLFSDSGGTTLVGPSGNVGLWRDKSGFGRNYAQATSGIRPTLSNNTVTTTNDTGQFLSNATTLAATGIDLFFVGKPHSVSGPRSRTLFRDNLAADVALFVPPSDTSSVLGYFTGGARREFTGIIVNGSARTLIYVSYSAARIPSAAINGTGTLVAGPVALTTNSQFDFLGGRPDVLQPWGEMNEVILVSNTTLQIRQEVEGYLAWKWGLQNNLPTTHPYYKFRP